MHLTPLILLLSRLESTSFVVLLLYPIVLGFPLAVRTSSIVQHFVENEGISLSS